MARSRNSSSKRTLRTEDGEEITAHGLQLADEYLAGTRELEMAASINPDADECPSCGRGRIVNCRCNRCGVAIPSSGTLKTYAFADRGRGAEEE